jgi:hypothetical protein
MRVLVVIHSLQDEWSEMDMLVNLGVFFHVAFVMLESGILSRTASQRKAT